MILRLLRKAQQYLMVYFGKKSKGNPDIIPLIVDDDLLDLLGRITIHTPQILTQESMEFYFCPASLSKCMEYSSYRLVHSLFQIVGVSGIDVYPYKLEVKVGKAFATSDTKDKILKAVKNYLELQNIDPTVRKIIEGTK